jgi:hypothetical protein
MNYSEFQIAAAPDGSSRIYRQYQPSGPSPVDLSNVAVEVRRVDSESRTVYETAIPWDELRASPDDPASVALIVNENDGDGRRGWIEWAAGIGANKDSSRFRHALFLGTDQMPADGSSSASEDGDEEAADGAASGSGADANGGDGAATATSAPGLGPLAVAASLVLSLLARRRR